MRTLALASILLLLVLPPASVAQAPAEHVHLGIPEQDASTTRSVVWYEAVPRPNAALTLSGPDGERTVEASRVDGPSAGVVYEATLTDLVPGASYTYTVLGRTFPLEMPPADLADGPLVIAATGDMGVSDRARETVATIAEIAPELILHAGDISYAEGNQIEWHTWFEMVEEVAASTPWVTALGNHEVGPLGIGNFPVSTEVDYYEQRFSLPHNEIWYSFDWRGVHIVALDTFSSLDAPVDEQIAWLEADLADAADAHWTIAFLHEPLYSSNSHGSSPTVQEAFEAILVAGGVDLVVAAHDHGYERSYPMVAGAATETHSDTYTEGAGVVHLVTGGGGQSLYTGWEEPAPAWSAARESLYHVTELRITPDRLEGRVHPTTSNAFTDSFAIVKTADAPIEDPPSETPLSPWVVVVALAVALATTRCTGSRRDRSP